MRILIAYHYFEPDSVVSARHFADLARAARDAGHEVTVLTGNARRHSLSIDSHPEHVDLQGMKVYRIARPNWIESGRVARLVAGLVLLWRWYRVARRLPPQDAVIVGTDPPFSAWVGPWLKRAVRAHHLAQWAFDLYPDAIVADRPSLLFRVLAALARALNRLAYRHFDDVVDLGPAMRRRLAATGAKTTATIPPWALVEPHHPAAPPSAQDPVRRAAFGEATLGLLYAGNLGYAHPFAPLLDLAARTAAVSDRVAWAFACSGARAADLATAAAGHTNVRILPWVPEAELAARLTAADIHLVALAPRWSGVVVPSKFFAALAAARPVLFCGPSDSDVAAWIRKYGVGWVLEPNDEANSSALAQELADLARAPEQLEVWRARALAAYHAFAARRLGILAWRRLWAEWEQARPQ